MEDLDGSRDAELVACAREGDRIAFGHLLTRHWQFASSVCARLLLGDRDAIDDVLQETSVVALVSLDRLRDPDRFGAWLCGIALNVARRRIRETRRTHPAPALSGAVIHSDRGPAEHAEAADLARRVRDAISHLPSGQRDAVLLFYLQGLTHREVAAELDISINAVKARLHQARAALEPKLASLHERKEPATMTLSPTWIDVQISDVRRGEGDQDPASLGQPHVVVLTDTATDRQLPIWIGRFEATALATTLDSVEMPRPMTYQFAANLLDATEWQVSEVRITSLTAGTFYAQLILEHLGHTRTIEARPSDALNLAVLSDVPIRVDKALLENPKATRQPDWRTYPTKAPDLAEEVRQDNQRIARWLQSLQQDTDSDEPGTGSP